MANTLFVTGTDTDVGKTYISGLLLKALQERGEKAAYYKAAMSGNERKKDGTILPGDALHVQRVSGLSQPINTMCPYLYEHAYSPHLAARLEGNPVKLERVLDGFDQLCHQYDYVVTEGSGGILCPLRFDEEGLLSLSDFVLARQLPCLLVAHAGLGTLNHVGLTAAYLHAQGIPLRGILLNHFQPGNLLHEDNRAMCSVLTGVPVVACVEEGQDQLPPSLLDTLFPPEKGASL